MRVRTSRVPATRYGTDLVRVNCVARSGMGASLPGTAIKNGSLRQRIPLLFIKIALSSAIYQAAQKDHHPRFRNIQTFKVEEECLGSRNHRRIFSVRQDPLQARTAHAKCGLCLLDPTLAAALLDGRRVSARRGRVGEKSGLFEQPAGVSSLWCHMCGPSEFSRTKAVFPQPAKSSYKKRRAP